MFLFSKVVKQAAVIPIVKRLMEIVHFLFLLLIEQYGNNGNMVIGKNSKFMEIEMKMKIILLHTDVFKFVPYSYGISKYVNFWFFFFV
jgi:hypothetical protein